MNRPPRPVRYAPQQVVVVGRDQSGGKAVKAGWLILLASVIFAAIPGLGFLIYLLGVPLLIVAFVLGVVAIVKGRTAGGVLLMLFTLIIAPIAFMVVPLISISAVGEKAEVRDSRRTKIQEEDGSH